MEDRREVARIFFWRAATFEHVVNVISTAGIKMAPTMGVYATTKKVVRTVTEVLRQEAEPNLRVTEVSAGWSPRTSRTASPTIRRNR